MALTTARRWIARAPGSLDALDLVDATVPDPGPGEVTIEVRAAGVNPADWKQVIRGTFDRPVPLGYEVSGVIAALGPHTQIASGGGAVGDDVVAFRVRGGYASALTVPAADVFAKPAALDHPAAANLLLVGTTAADMLHVAAVDEGELVLVHGASGAVGVSLLQQARLLGARVVGTASPTSFDVVRRFDAVPVAYGEGLVDRLRAAAPGPFVAALDTVGTDEAVEASLALVPLRDRIVTIAAFERAQRDGFRAVAGVQPASRVYRDEARAALLALAARGDLVVPVARTYPLEQAPEALAYLRGGHPGGKLALIP